jgi:hypothetical protein
MPVVMTAHFRVITYIATDECGNASSPLRLLSLPNDDVAIDWKTKAARGSGYHGRFVLPMVVPNLNGYGQLSRDNTATVMVDSDVTTPTNAGCG